MIWLHMFYFPYLHIIKFVWRNKAVSINYNWYYMHYDEQLLIIMLDGKQIRADVIGKKVSAQKSNNKCIKNLVVNIEGKLIV